MEYEVIEFIKNYPQIKKLGSKITNQEVEQLNPKIKSVIPKWYIDLLQKYPIAGVDIGIPYDYGQEEFIGKPLSQLPILNITINDLKTIEDYSLNYFPGCYLLSKKYICIAKDNDCTQEGIYINVTEPDPKFLLVFHDLGSTTKALIRNAEILLDKFSDLFKIGVVENK